MQAIFIGKNGANVKKIVDACQSGVKNDPCIELRDLKIPTAAQESQNFACVPGESGSSLECHSQNGAAKSKLVVQVIVCSNDELVFIHAIKLCQKHLSQVYASYVAELIKFKRQVASTYVPEAVLIKAHYPQSTICNIRGEFRCAIANDIMLARHLVNSAQYCHDVDEEERLYRGQGDCWQGAVRSHNARPPNVRSLY